MKKKGKQIMAMVSIILLIGMYVLTLFAAILDNPHTMKMFLGCVCTTIALPILMWIYLMFCKIISSGSPNERAERIIEEMEKEEQK